MVNCYVLTIGYLKAWELLIQWNFKVQAIFLYKLKDYD